MTCILGWVDEGQSIMMADTGASSGDGLMVSMGPHKLFRLGTALVGVSGLPRVAQLLRLRAPPPAEGILPDPLCSIVDWTDVVRTILRTAGLVCVKDGVEEMDARLLVAFHGLLVEIDTMWQVITPVYPFWAIGSGQRYAIAAMQALALTAPLPPRAMLRTAMRVAAAFDPCVTPPFEELRNDMDSAALWS